MFKISKLIMFDMNNESYTYAFSEGINYFIGENNSGKTEFYLFIDFMFGSSESIMKKPWYKDTLNKATMEFEYNGNSFCITRTRNPNENYLHYADEKSSDSIDLREYKDKLNSIFTQDLKLLKDIRKFTNEELTYRTFTMFNFLGEKGQGKIHDFLDKCNDIRYSVKLNPILNFIFNKNLERIYQLQNELDILLQEIKDLENNVQKFEFVVSQVNKNLKRLGGGVWYTGKNVIAIKKYISDLKEMQNITKNEKIRNITDLEVMYNNLSEQIKVYENNIADAKQFEKDNTNRKKLLCSLQDLLEKSNDLNYLINPIQQLLKEIDNTIFFSNYIINDNTIKELKRQREQIKIEIQRNDSRFKCYSLEEKSKAIALIEDYLTIEIIDVDEDLKKKKTRVREIREELKALQNSDDIKKINELSEFITNLYSSAKEISSVVSDDIEHNGFKIQYLKKGNILQPIVLTDAENNDQSEYVNYYIGSMARHTLIQLCGYLAFLKILLENNKFPVIPILVIDHISKPFDENNCNAIGKVISTAYEVIGKENLQTFIFDDKDFSKLDIAPEHSEKLINDKKTGFNPFYKLN